MKRTRVGGDAFKGALEVPVKEALERWGAKSIQKAVDDYHSWHQKDPDKVLVADGVKLPESLYAVGRSRELEYASDKWEDDGARYLYGHDSDSGPTVYCAKKYPWAGKSTSTAALLAVRNLEEPITLPILGVATYIIYDDTRNRSHKLVFQDEAVMCGALDRAAVVILTNAGPVVIRGGKLSISWRGIIH